jgi:hypothetical protein
MSVPLGSPTASLKATTSSGSGRAAGRTLAPRSTISQWAPRQFAEPSVAPRRPPFQSLTEMIDTTTPAGRLQFHIFGALAEFANA